MLSGNRAFRGDTSADVMMSLLNEDPADLPAAERHIPTGLVRTVERCLEKNPGARFQSATDLAFALETLSSPSGETSASAAPDSCDTTPLEPGARRAGRDRSGGSVGNRRVALFQTADCRRNHDEISTHDASRLDAGDESRRHVDSPTRRLTGWASHRVSCPSDRGQPADDDVDSGARQLGASDARWDGWRRIAVLVAGQPTSGVFRCWGPQID